MGTVRSSTDRPAHRRPAGPIALEVRVGGFGPMWSVVLVGNTVHYTNDGWGDHKESKTPLTSKAWSTFIRECEQLRIWNWRANDAPSDSQMATDLPVWEVLVQTGSKAVCAGGYGRFPAEFRSFVTALAPLASREVIG